MYVPMSASKLFSRLDSLKDFSVNQTPFFCKKMKYTQFTGFKVYLFHFKGAIGNLGTKKRTIKSTAIKTGG